MWSLPDIKRMNAEAAVDQTKKARLECNDTLKDERGEPLECPCGEPAVVAEPWYDVMSDNPKGIAAACEDHTVEDDEELFRCNDCGRLMVDHYTWERYGRNVPGLGKQCLACAAKQHFGDPDNVVKLTKRGIAAVDAKFVKAIPHVLAVEQPVPDGWEYIDNIEWDYDTSGVLTSTMTSSNDPNTTVVELRGVLERAKADGYTEAVLAWDAAYQFSGSYGVYGKTATRKKQKRAKK